MNRAWLAGCAVASCVVACGESAPPPQLPPAPLVGAPTTLDGLTHPGLRLSPTVRPISYDLSLTIDPREETFSGEVTIVAVADAATDAIWLNGEDMTVESVTVTPLQQAPRQAQWIAADDGFAAIRLAEAVPSGELSITVRYEAPFNQSLEGLYKVTAQGEDYAFTQFEPLDARKAFPSFDQPEFKTPYDIELIVDEEHTAVTNSLLVDERVEDGRRRMRFATTQPLPTYLVAFAAGPLDIVDAGAIPAHGARSHAIPLRGVAVRGRGEEMRFALAETPKILAEAERYFGIPYPYDKLDLIAVPDFWAGAMENVGAVTFRDYFLLFDESEASEEQIKAFYYITAHELAHMWFGNLTTMQWWDDLWLNEAFASWMEHRITHALRPEFQADVELLEWANHAMDADALSNARRIREPIETVDDIHNAFDYITYGKGAAVLTMFEQYVGEERFRQGVQQYLNDHRHANATAEDLIGAVENAAGKPLEASFLSFLTQPGQPHLAMRARCEGGSVKVGLEQRRFVPLGGAASPDASWTLPVCMRVGTGSPSCETIEAATATLTLPVSSCPTTFVPNVAAAGYYRWSLGEAEGVSLSARADDAPALEQLDLALNRVAQLNSGDVDIETVLPELLEMARRDLGALPRLTIELLINLEDELLDEAPPGFRTKAREALGEHYNRLGWERAPDESSADSSLRPDVIDFLANTARVPAVESAAAKRGASLLGLDGAIDDDAAIPDLRGPTLLAAIRTRGVEAVDAAIARLNDTDDAGLRRPLVRALFENGDPELVRRSLPLLLTDTLRDNEVRFALRHGFALRSARDEVHGWLVAHAEQVEKRLAPAEWGKVGRSVAGCSEADAERAQRDFGAVLARAPGGARNLAGAIENIRICAAFAARHGDSTRAFFR